MAVAVNESSGGGDASALAGDGLVADGATLDNTLIVGKAGGQTLVGGTGPTDVLTIQSSTDPSRTGLIDLVGQGDNGVARIASATTTTNKPLLLLESTSATGSALLTFRANGATRAIVRSDFNGSLILASTSQILMYANGDGVTQIMQADSAGPKFPLGIAGNNTSAFTFDIQSTTHATKGLTRIGGSAGLVYDETNKRLGVGIAAATNTLLVNGGIEVTGNTVAGSGATIHGSAAGGLTFSHGGAARMTIIGAAISITNGQDFTFSTGVGTKMGTGATQKIGFYNATPVAQQSGTGETVGFVAGGGTTATDASTFTGNVGSTAYRISDVVKALKNLGFLAA